MGIDTAFIIFAALLAGLARGFSGFGAALIFMPLASAVIGPQVAGPVLLFVDMVLTAPMVPGAFRLADRREVSFMSLGAFAGIPFGTWILLAIDPLLIRWGMVVAVVLTLALLSSGWRYSGRPAPSLTSAVGVLSGLLSGSIQIGGPPVIAYWLGGSATSATVRANIVLYFAVAGTAAALSYFVSGLITSALLVVALMAGPSYGIGLFVGSRLFGLASERTFRRACYALIALAGLIGLPLLDPLFGR
jgi:uncharacterized protein